MKRFLVTRLREYEKYLSQELPILDGNGDKTVLLNFDFADNSTEFLDDYEQIESAHAASDAQGKSDLNESNLLKSKLGFKMNLSNAESQLIEAMKLTDSDIEGFL